MQKGGGALPCGEHVGGARGGVQHRPGTTVQGAKYLRPQRRSCLVAGATQPSIALNRPLPI